VGPATALPPVQLTGSAPTTIDVTAIQTWLQGKLDSNDPAWPVNDANTVYILHYPATTATRSTGRGEGLSGKKWRSPRCAGEAAWPPKDRRRRT